MLNKFMRSFGQVHGFYAGLERSKNWGIIGLYYSLLAIQTVITIALFIPAVLFMVARSLIRGQKNDEAVSNNATLNNLATKQLIPLLSVVAIAAFGFIIYVFGAREPSQALLLGLFGAFAVLIFVIILLPIVLFISYKKKKASEGIDDLDADLTPAELDIKERLATALMDYYSPRSEFSIEVPIYDAGTTPQQKADDKKKLEANNEIRRYNNAYSHTVSVKEIEDKVFAVVQNTRVSYGSTDDDLIKKTNYLKTALKAKDILSYDLDEDEGGQIGIEIWFKKKPLLVEILANTKVSGDTFFVENRCLKSNPSKDIFSIALGLDTRGNVWTYPLHHGICVGRTGAGKGSFVQGLIVQLAPFVEIGFARLWIADPKNAEAAGYVGTSLFHRIADEDEEIIELIREFAAELRIAKKTGSRKNIVSAATPANILFIDEFTTLTDEKSIMNSKNELGRTVEEEIKFILRQGRSLNYFLIGAAQEATDTAGKLMKNMPSKVLLQVEGKYESAKVLGIPEGELQNPNIIFPIPASNSENGYRYSGIANVKSEGTSMKAIRLAYTSDDEIDALADRFAIDPSAVVATVPAYAPEEVEEELLDEFPSAFEAKTNPFAAPPRPMF